MNSPFRYLILLCVVLPFYVRSNSYGQYAWTNFAGVASGIGSADGAGTAAKFYAPNALAIDSAGNTYVADAGNFTIRKITSTGTVSTIAGQAGVAGTVDGTGTAARFSGLSAIAVDSAGTNLYIACDTTIRKMALSTSVVTTLAGAVGKSGGADGIGSAATFNGIDGLVVDWTGATLYVADSGNTIRKIVLSTKEVSTLAGTTGTVGNVNDAGAAARFNHPTGLALNLIPPNLTSTLYVCDTGNNAIREVSLSTNTPGVVTHRAGSTSGVSGSTDGNGAAARFNQPTGIALLTNGYYMIIDQGNQTLRRMTGSGAVATSAGSVGVRGFVNSGSTVARFSKPSAVAALNNQVVIADTDNHSIRLGNAANIASVSISTLAGQGPAIGAVNGSGTSVRFRFPSGVAVDPGVLPYIYVAERENHIIKKISSVGISTTLAGAVDTPGSADGNSTAAQFRSPNGVAVDSSGYVYVADTGNHLIRKISPVGITTTLAGTGTAGSADGTGLAAQFNAPTGVAVDAMGNVYVADSGNSTIRKITSAGVVTTLAGKAGHPGWSEGAVANARFMQPWGIALDMAGNLYVTDAEAHAVSKIYSFGVVITLAGGEFAGLWDGPTTTAEFELPKGIAVDAIGNVFVTDEGSHTIRKISTAGIVSTIGGNPAEVPGGSDGVGQAAHFYSPSGIAVAADGTLFVADQENQRVSKGMASTAANLEVRQGRYDFLTDGVGSIDFGSNSSASGLPLSFTITNTGGVALTGIASNKTGPHPGDFVITGLPTTLAIGASATFIVTYTPAATGVRQAVLNLTATNVTGPANPFAINLTGLGVAAPGNNNFSSRINLGNVATVSTTGTNVGASLETNELTYGTIAGASVWYEWTAPASGWTSIDTHGSALDTVVALYTGATLTTLSELGFNNDTADALPYAYDVSSKLVFYAVSGTSYKIAVAGYNDGDGPERNTFNLNIKSIPVPSLVVNSINFTPANVNVSTTFKDVTVAISVTSTPPVFDANGDGSLSGSVFPSSSTNTYDSGVSFYFSASDRTVGTSTSPTATYTTDVSIPIYVAGGAWSLQLNPASGPLRWTTPGADLLADDYLIPVANSAVLNVTNTGVVDTTPPTLVSITGMPATVDVRNGDVSFNVDIAVTDAGSGVDDSGISLRLYSANGVLREYPLGDAQITLLSGTTKNGVYRIPITINQTAISGYYFTQFTLYDFANNSVLYSDISSVAIPATTPGHSIQIIGAAAAPEIYAYAETLDLGEGVTVDFGTVATGASSSKTITIENIGYTGLSDLAVTVDGAQALDYSVTAIPSATLLPYGQLTFTLTFAPTAAGSRQATMRIFSNDPGVPSPMNISLTGNAPGNILNWRQQYFSSPNNTANGANDADPNKNGIVNLLEYALGGNPVNATTGVSVLPVLSLKMPQNRLQLTFKYYPANNDVSIHVQAADDLAGPWTTLATSTSGGAFSMVTAGTTIVNTPVANAVTTSVCDVFPVNDPVHKRRFMRIEVVQ